MGHNFHIPEIFMIWKDTNGLQTIKRARSLNVIFLLWVNRTYELMYGITRIAQRHLHFPILSSCADFCCNRMFSSIIWIEAHLWTEIVLYNHIIECTHWIRSFHLYAKAGRNAVLLLCFLTYSKGGHQLFIHIITANTCISRTT